MSFKNRQEAGEKLAEKLSHYKDNKEVIILALPRGGVVTGFEIAKKLHVTLDVICPRKIGSPFNPELAIGAITETGDGIFNDLLIMEYGISEKYIQEKVAEEKKQAERRLNLFRKNKPKRNLEDKIVILVDDGLATGSTMKAAIQTVKNEYAAKIIVAVPVSPPETLTEIESEVDEVYCLETPSFFAAIGQFYEDFTQVEDEEVIELLSCMKSASPF